MDQSLSSLFPLHQIGSDGFSWWIGQIESERSADPKKAGRYKVRIVGQHLKSCDSMPTEELPWAMTMLPVTTPYSDSNRTGASSNLHIGDWVIGFYLDSDEKQIPIVMGSIGHVPGSTVVVNQDPNPGGQCKSFTRYATDVNPATDLPASESDGRAGENSPYETGSNTMGGPPVASSRAGEEGGWPSALMGAFGENSETNPTGGKFCVVVANPKCGTEKNLKSSLTYIIGDMLRANQQSNGQLGDYYVSKATGELNEQLSIGRYHITRATRLVKSLMARAKGEIITELKGATKSLIDTVLYEKDTSIIPEDINKPLSTEEKNALEGAKEVLAIAEANKDVASAKAAMEEYDRVVKQINATRGHPAVAKKKSRIKGIQTLLDNLLKEIGCKMEDLTDKLAQWLTDLLLGYIQDAFNAATCLIDELVNGIINEILGYIDTLINDVLGGLQALLGMIASPLNIIGNALAKILNLLGISCSGPDAKCEKIQVTCTDCATSQEEGDFLDNLIKSIEQGDLDFSNNICDEAKNYPQQPPTNIRFIGGVYQPPKNPNSNVDTGDDIPSDNVELQNTTYGSINYSSEDIEVYEGQPAIFTITRSGKIDVSSSLTYKLSPQNINIGATLGADFEQVETSGIIAFSPGETTKTIEFKTFLDTVDEGTEIFEVELGESSTPEGCYAVFETSVYLICTIKELIPNDDGNIPDSSSPADTVPSNLLVSDIPGGSSPNLTIVEVPTYDVTSDKEIVSEGETVKFIITTTNVSDTTVLNYTISGDVNSSDIVGGNLTGTCTVNSNQSEVSITLQQNEDDPVQNEVLTFTIDGTTANKTITITDQPSTSPVYKVVSDKASVNEGETVRFTITTKNVSDLTNLDYTLSGSDISEDDIDGGKLTGSVVIKSNTGFVDVVIKQDELIEINPKLLRFSLNNTSAFAEVVINSDEVFIETDVTTIKKYSVSSDKLSYQEGETIIYTVQTENVSDGTILYYKLFGTNISESDFVMNSLRGNFVITNNTATVFIGIETDTSIEGEEVLTFSIDSTNAFSQVIIEADVVEPTPKKPVDPCVNPPSATAITDQDGKIISIQIDDKGCPYIIKPQVIITGNGYGASAIPLLDSDGYVSEIRLTRMGINYKKNIPENLNCIIDSFTMIRPGQNYTSEPTVYIDGNPNIAKAIIEDGFVKGIVVLDRTVKYTKMPSVVILGGGGMGAKFLASLSCLSPEELEAKGYAKIGTGKYIDCP